MTAKAIRKRLSDKDIEELCALAQKGEALSPHLSKMVGHIADGYGEAWREVVEAAPHTSSVAENIIVRANEREIHGRESLPTRIEAFSSKIVPSARAIAFLDHLDVLADPFISASLGKKRNDSLHAYALKDGSLVATALAIAIAESLDGGATRSSGRLQHLEPMMSEVGSVIENEWHATMMSHLPRIEKHAELCGHHKQASIAKACAEGVRLSGKAMQGESSPELVFGLGVAALGGVTKSQNRLPKISDAVILGGVALNATFGFPVGWRLPHEGKERGVLVPVAPLEDFDRYDASHEFTFVAFGLFPLCFTWGELEPLSLLTISSAAERLEKASLSPRVSEEHSRRYLILAEAARKEASEFSEDTSFSKILGVREVISREGDLRDEERLFPAAPIGHRPSSFIVKGRGNRLMRLRAVADEKGYLVGYMGVDPLSEEFHGNPERYVYDLDGWRRGRMVDGIYRKSLPKMKMMTAPEGIEIKKPV